MRPLKYLATKLERFDTRLYGDRTGQLDGDIATRAAKTKPCSELINIVEQAWLTGRSLDLSGIGYGPAHWKTGDQFLTHPDPYYYFLAGLVRSQFCNRIFEVGTHYGGSSLSMLRGAVSRNEIKIVTVDITDLNPALHGSSEITKLIGDANSEVTIKQSILAMGAQRIDVLYIDADHRFLPTLTSLGLYVLLMNPRFIVIDDIMLNESMRSLWNALCVMHGSKAINCVDVIPNIRSKSCGFGLLRFR